MRHADLSRSVSKNRFSDKPLRRWNQGNDFFHDSIFSIRLYHCPSASAPFTHPPELPAGNIRANTIIRRPKVITALLRSQILHDRTRLLQEKITVLQRG